MISSITPSVGAATFPQAVFATIGRQQVKMRQSILGVFLTCFSLPPDGPDAHHPGRTGINAGGFSVIKYRKCEYNSQSCIYYYLDSSAP